MGGREVNSTALKLYLIFIHMNAPGRDRLPQTNWNAWDQGGLQRGKKKKTGRWCACVCVYEFLRVYKEGRIHWYGWKDTNHYRILISYLPAYTHTHLYYLVSRMKTQLIPVDATFLLRDIADGRLYANSEVLMAHWTISLQTGPLSPYFLYLSVCMRAHYIHTISFSFYVCFFLYLSLNIPLNKCPCH